MIAQGLYTTTPVIPYEEYCSCSVSSNFITCHTNDDTIYKPCNIILIFRNNSLIKSCSSDVWLHASAYACGRLRATMRRDDIL